MANFDEINYWGSPMVSKTGLYFTVDYAFITKCLKKISK